MLPKVYRLCKADFELIKQQPLLYKINLNFFIIKIYKNYQTNPKAAFIISKKNISKASHRNLTRRRLKQLFYINRDKIGNYCYIFIIKGGFNIKTLTYENLSSDFNTFLSKISKFRDGLGI